MTGNPFLSQAAISRILVAAGIKELRPHIDRKALESCLKISLELYRNAARFKGKKLAVQIRSNVKKVRLAAIELRTLLNARASFELNANFEKILAQLSDLISDQERLLELNSLSAPRTGKEWDYVNGLAYADHFKAKSPLQWLVGVYLPEVCEIFSIELSGKRYAEFAHQILKELKVKDGNASYSSDAIARAARGYHRYRKLAPLLDQDEWTADRDMRFSYACGVSETQYLSIVLLAREKEKSADAKRSISGPK